MRSLGYSTLLAASLVVAPACSKKDEASGDAAAKDAKAGEAGDAKAGEKQAEAPAVDQAKPTVEAKPIGEGGLLGAAATAAPIIVAGFPSSIALIPDQAQFVVGLSPKSITGSPVYALAAAELAGDPDFQSALSTFKDCGLNPDTFESVVVGASMTEDFVAVIIGDGIGEDKNASCVIKNIQKLAGDAQVADVVTQAGKKLIQFTDGRAYLVDDRTLAIVTTAWESAVGELLDGKGTGAAAASKKDLFTKVNGAASVWGVADLPPEIVGMAPLLGAPPEFTDIKSVTGSIDMSSGAAVQALAVFGSADKAKSVASQLQAMLGLATGEVPPELGNVVKSIKIEAVGTDLKISMSATMDDINAAKAAAPPM